MAGVKGKSGRKSSFGEFQDGCLLAKTTAWLLNNFDSFSKEEKLRVALIIAPKGIADKHEHSGALDVSSILNRMTQIQPSLQ